MNLKDPNEPLFSDGFIVAVMVCVVLSVACGLVMLYA